MCQGVTLLSVATSVSQADAEQLLGQSGHELVVLPLEIAGDGTGYYHDQLLGLVKELRGSGVDAAYAHDAAGRSWIDEKSFLPELISFAVGIGSNGGGAGPQTLFSRRHKSRKVSVKVARCVQTDDGPRWEWYEFQGTGEEIAARARVA